MTNLNLLWLDLEMTGLEPTKDRILEVAVILTNGNLEKRAMYESGVLQDEQEIRQLLGENEFAKNRPAETEELITISLSGVSEADVQKEILALIDAHFGNQDVFLAGNSIHADKGFVKQWWPELHKRLHYRMLDVSAWKLVYEAHYNRFFKKAETHRALADIEESIAELKFYQKFIKP
jgi:oligoribonuclease